MKNVLLITLLMTSFNSFASSAMGEDYGIKECKESLQDSRKSDLEAAKKEIFESTKESTQQSNV